MGQETLARDRNHINANFSDVKHDPMIRAGRSDGAVGGPAGGLEMALQLVGRAEEMGPDVAFGAVQA